MEDRLAREEQIVEAPKAPVEEQHLALDPTVLAPESQALIARCMDGSEPMDTPRKSYEVQKLNATHIQMIMLRLAGFKPPEISGMVGHSIQSVYQTLIHPYARKILQALAPAQYGRVINIRTRMEEQAEMLMDHAFVLAMKSEELKDVKEVTFGFLDRAGYNVVNKQASVTGAPKDFAASDHTLSRLASALDESKCVDTIVMPNFTPPRPPEEGAGLNRRSTFDLSVAEPEVVGPQSSDASESQNSAGQGAQFTGTEG